jgi:two-component system sensor histidine kinase TctE
MPASSSRSLRRQLLTWLLALLIPLLLVGAVASYYRANYFANLAYDRSLLRSALALADQVEVERGQVIADLPQIAHDLLEYDKDDWIYYRISGPNGQIVTGQAALPPPSVLPRAGEHRYYDARFDGNAIRVVAFSLALSGTSAEGIALILVGETRTKRHEMAGEIMATMMLPQLLIVLLAGIMVYFGVGRGLFTLEKLRAAFSRRSHLDLSPISETDAPLEVQPLLHAVNDLMQRLRHAISRQQRFIADASHQLRTPLAGLITQAELALREDDPVQIQHTLQQIRTSSAALGRMVSQLLSLARAEPEAAGNMELLPLDLSRLAQEVTSDWVPQALLKKIDLGFAGTDQGCQITGNAILLRELISNLIDNAIRYTPSGGQVTVSIRPDRTMQESIELAVEDNGPGIPEKKRERIFEPFYRILGTGEEGCGLGLTIVSEIAQRHRAEIRIENAERGGTKMSVLFRSSQIAS